MNETQKPWVSFCMSTFKRPDILKKTLHTILQQTFTNFEIVVSDNDPGCSAEPVIKEIGDKRVRYFNNAENLGMIKSFNKSIERAQAENIVMITDDDPVYPAMLQTLYDLSVSYPGYGVYHGACDVIYETAEMAESCRAKIGVNSCLANFAEGEVRQYSSAEFPKVFFNNEVNNYMLWSVCVVKKEILLKIGGIPDYGTPFMGDLAFTVLSCSEEGMVFINRSLGAQVVHGKNFGYVQTDNYAGYYKTADGFHQWVSARFSQRSDWTFIKPLMEKFIGRWMVGYGLSIRKHLLASDQSVKELNQVIKKIFRINYIAIWKWKYYIGAYFPTAFEYIIRIKKYLFK